MTTFHIDPAEAYVAKVVHQFVANEEIGALEDLAVSACIQGILEGSGTGPSAELYEQAFRDHADEYLLFCRTAGIYLRDALVDEIKADQFNQGIGFDLLWELLDLENQQLWAEIADRFMPDPERVWQVNDDGYDPGE